MLAGRAALHVLIQAGDVVQAADNAVLSWFAELRTQSLTDAARSPTC